MNHTDITTYIALAISVINIIVSIYIAIKQPKTTRINPLLKNQLDQVFVPFQNLINKKLFKKVNEENINEIHSALTTLYSKLKDTELEFGLSFYTVYYLKIIVDSNIPTTKNQFVIFNRNYKNFSAYYYKDLNKLRKQFGLPKYRNNYRLLFDLYPSTWNRIIRVYWIPILLYVLSILASIIIEHMWTIYTNTQ